MILVCVVFGTPCPYCGESLDAEPTWECDGPPYPDATLDCPKCKRPIYVSQHVVTRLCSKETLP